VYFNDVDIRRWVMPGASFSNKDFTTFNWTV
jgi:hypothetical protein